MLDNDNKNDYSNETHIPDDKTLVKALAFGAIFIIMIVYIFASGKAKPINIELEPSVSSEEFISFFDKVKDNYSLEIEKELNGNKSKLLYTTDGTLELYEGNLLDKEGILVYKDKPFYIVDDTKELKPYKGNTSFMNDLYYDYDFIKSLIPLCELKIDNTNRISCIISNNDYLNEYNKIKETNVSEYDGNIVFEFVYNGVNPLNITVDYSDINKAINNTDDTIKYTIDLVAIGNNDYSILMDQYKDILQK